MAKRTTVILEDGNYDALVKESIERYNNAKSLSKVLNEILDRALADRSRWLNLIRAKKVAHTTAREFEQFREGLSGSV